MKGISIRYKIPSPSLPALWLFPHVPLCKCSFACNGNLCHCALYGWPNSRPVIQWRCLHFEESWLMFGTRMFYCTISLNCIFYNVFLPTAPKNISLCSIICTYSLEGYHFPVVIPVPMPAMLQVSYTAVREFLVSKWKFLLHMRCPVV